MGLNDKSGFQPLALEYTLTWGVAPGWYGFGPLALSWANWNYRIRQPIRAESGGSARLGRRLGGRARSQKEEKSDPDEGEDQAEYLLI